jgi:hypothetical protein
VTDISAPSIRAQPPPFSAPPPSPPMPPPDLCKMILSLIPPTANGTSHLPSPSPVVPVSPGVSGALPTPVEVANFVAVMSVKMRRCSGTHLVPQSGAAGSAALTAIPAQVAAGAKPNKSCVKPPSPGSRGKRAKSNLHGTVVPLPLGAIPPRQPPPAIPPPTCSTAVLAGKN